MANTRAGRKKGGRDQGYFYRKGRGWYVTKGSQFIPLCYEDGHTAAQQDEASITCWGTGRASREFLYVDDATRGVVAAAERMDEPTPINLGTGREIGIADLVKLIAAACGFQGRIAWDAARPDGQPRRCLDTSKAAKWLDWKAAMPLGEHNAGPSPGGARERTV